MKTNVEVNNEALTFPGVLAEADKFEHGYAEQKGNIAAHIMALAHGCNDLEQFKTGKQTAEVARKLRVLETALKAGKTKEEVAILEKLPRCWIQTCSDISKLWEAGHSPKEYSTYSQLKKAKDALAAQRNPQRKVSPNTGVDKAASAVASIPVAGAGSKNQAILQSMVNFILTFSDEKQEEVIMELQTVLDGYGFDEVVATDETVSDQDALEAAQIGRAVGGAE